MTLSNFQRALRSFTGRRPFRPFVIDFMSGDRLRITHPEAVALRGEVVVYQNPQTLYRLFDSDSVCQLLDMFPPEST